jgi:hypothetical protein
LNSLLYEVRNSQIEVGTIRATRKTFLLQLRYSEPVVHAVAERSSWTVGGNARHEVLPYFIFEKASFGLLSDWDSTTRMLPTVDFVIAHLVVPSINQCGKQTQKSFF